MCSVGSSNVNILHPPSHSTVPAPGIPLPSNGRLVPSLFLFLSLRCPQTHTGLLSFCPDATPPAHLFPSFLTCHIHFFISSLNPLHPALFISLPFFFSIKPLHLHSFLPASPSLQLLSHLGLFALWSVNGCRQCEQGQQSPPVSIQAPAEICNARQRSAMQG